MNGFGHRRNAQSEDVRSLSPTWAHSEAQLGRRAALDFDSMGQDYFLRSITKPDGSLAPPSSNKLGTSGLDSLGLGLDGGAASSIYAQTFGSVDEEDVGGVGAHRGRRRGSSASSLSPYSRPLSMASSPSISRLELATGGIGRSNNGNATGGVVKNAADEADVIPLADVERQHVTTPATELASSKRRKNNAVFTCTVEGCTSTFTRKFNLRGTTVSCVSANLFRLLTDGFATSCCAYLPQVIYDPTKKSAPSSAYGITVARVSLDNMIASVMRPSI